MAESALKRPSPLLPVFITVFIDLLGIGIIIPVFAPLLINNEHGMLPLDMPEASRNLIYGILTASFPIFQFFGAPLLGALADRFGRRRILLISLFGTLAGYLLFALSIEWRNLPLLFLARAIPGFTGGNISIVLASLADISEQKDKAKNFGLVGTAFGMGFILGPALGGVLASPRIHPWFTYATPLWFTALLTVLNILYVWRQFPETLQTRSQKPVTLFAGFGNLKKAFLWKELQVVLLTLFLQTFGFAFFMQFFQVYLIKKFDFNQENIGLLFAYVGLWIAFTQGVVTRVLSHKAGPDRILRTSILGLSMSLFCILLPTRPWMLMLTQPLVAIFQGITQPNATSLVSSMASRETQGEILGVQQSIQSVALALPPLIAGIVVTLDFRLPIILAGSFLFLAWLNFYTRFKGKRVQAA